ncbi:MAG: hypothetical protein OXT71_16335 [Acidobacteriota bacterium]|nr:hypothetical protein [Acidobacteriota bacterium]
MSARDSQTRLTWMLLVLLALLSLVLGAFILNGARSNWGPVDHPQFSTMERSGWSWENNDPLLAGVWLVGVLQIAVFLCLLGLGLAGRKGSGLLRVPLLLGGLLHAGIFSWMILAHVHPVAPSLWSFPPPTVVMVFFLWILPPIYFVILYVVSFDRWILTEEAHRDFLRLVRSRRGKGRG